MAERVRVTLTVELDRVGDEDRTAEQVADELRSAIEDELGDLWVGDGDSAYRVDFASIVQFSATRARTP